MRISHKHGYIYLAVPKTASSSIRLALDKEGRNENGYIADVKYPHTGAKSVKDKYSSWDDYFKFAFVRNPWSRYVSSWAYSHKYLLDHPCTPFAEAVRLHFAEYGETFEQYASTQSIKAILAKNYLTTQSGQLMLDGEMAMDFVGRFENIERDFSYVCERLRIHPKLETVNTSPHRPYREMYSAETKRAVGEAYGEDVEMFGYEF